MASRSPSAGPAAVTTALLLCLCACASAPPAVDATKTRAAIAEEQRGRDLAFVENEKRALEAIAVTDPRFARRMDRSPSEDELRAAVVKALAAGDADLSVHDGALDSFSFAARARGLDEAAQIVSQAPELSSDSVDAGVPVPGMPLEHELIVRLVAEERARLEEERALPRGASSLIRAVVETWTPPGSPEAATERDAWLARRLDGVRASLAGATLPRAAIFELDDALDPLERLGSLSELPSTAKAIARLRVALGETRSAANGADTTRWARLHAALQVHLGVASGAAAVRERLEQAERALRSMAKSASAHLDERALSKRAESLTFAPGACDARPAESRVRALAPPPERAAICGSLRALHDALDDQARAATAVALHDEVVVALWALAIHEGGLPPDRATAIAHPYFGAEPDREARWVRLAEARPVAAIGAGLAAELVLRASAASSVDPSGRWLAFGDAPLDVVERELFTSVAPTSPASPRP